MEIFFELLHKTLDYKKGFVLFAKSKEKKSEQSE